MEPSIRPEMLRKLREVHNCFTPKWNRVKERWEIWFVASFRKPYLLMAVTNDDGSYRPIDSRTINHLRFIKWASHPDRIIRLMKKDIQDEWYRGNKREEDDLDMHTQAGKELYHPFQMLMRDLGLWSGKSKIPVVQGFGEGKSNAVNT
jgi:hypothetical protein